VHVYPPYAAGAPRPITVMLHGMCNAPQWECPYFADAIRKHSWLVCPKASIPCEGGGAIWSHKKFPETVENAVSRVKARYPNQLDESPGRTLMGFSLGAIRGMSLAHRGGGKWSSVILIGAKVHPNQKLLEQAGVRRLLMVAGDWDMMKWHMYRQAQKLERKGMDCAFLSLGKIGHQFPHDMNALMGRAYAWANGDTGALAAEPGDRSGRGQT
jgi:predicted esterase